MRILPLSAAVLLALAGAAAAQDAVTATCKDGTSWSGAHRGGACRGHGGVQAFGTAAVMPASPATPAPPVAAPAASNAPAPTPAAITPPPRPSPPPAASMPTAAGGGPGQVWVNTPTKVYHCPGDRWYGKTQHGSYVTEAAAKAAGDRPDHGKACS